MRLKGIKSVWFDGLSKEEKSQIYVLIAKIVMFVGIAILLLL